MRSTLAGAVGLIVTATVVSLVGQAARVRPFVAAGTTHLVYELLWN